MIFTPTSIPDAYLVDIERLEDERGFFARTWCQEELAARGLTARLVQCSLSFNRSKGTLRGLHYQTAPHQEAKVVTCLRGRIFDVVVDLRPSSECFGRWESAYLDAASLRAFYVPEGCAHGFITLCDDTLVHYQTSQFYHAESARGVRWNDPSLAIPWPIEPAILSKRDASFGPLPPRSTLFASDQLNRVDPPNE